MIVEGTLWIISSPSGGGKTSLVNALIQQLPNLSVSVSHTTRPPRQGEIDGKNYFFVDEGTFQALVNQQHFLEHAQVFNYRYGTSKQWVEEQLRKGMDVMLDIDWQGAKKIREQMPSQSIFILPPSREVLQKRLELRQDPPDVIARRMELASREISHYEEYDFLIVNDAFEVALSEMSAIVRAQRLKLAAQKARYQQLISSLA